MSLSGESTPVKRRSSVRSQPYDLRRRVLVKNFLKDQSTSFVAVRPATPRIPYQLQPIRRSNSLGTRRLRTDECSSKINKSAPSDDADDHDYSSSVKAPEFDEDTEHKDPNTFSRRLRATENSTLRQPYRKTRQSTTIHRSRKLTPESQILQFSRTPWSSKKSFPKISKSPSKSVLRRNTAERVLRSYPTFDKLNEILTCDSATYKKTIVALRSGGKKGFVSTPVFAKKSSRLSIRKSVSKLLKGRLPSENCPEVHAPSHDKKICKRRSFVSKLFSPFSGEKLATESGSWTAAPRQSSIMRSASFRAPPTPSAPKLQRRTQSVKLRCVRLTNDAF